MIPDDSSLVQLFEQLHPDWQLELKEQRGLINSIEKKIKFENFTPAKHLVFRSLTQPLSASKVVIFGQDPYPTPGIAQGLAFSVDPISINLPPSLKNIFKELASDLSTPLRSNGDLSDWYSQGVLLINRHLTTTPGKSMSHAHLGWDEITKKIAQILGERDVVALLWGATAIELSSNFRDSWRVQSAHPSPLSAYRGFFGSKPFSRCNEILQSHGLTPINW